MHQMITTITPEEARKFLKENAETIILDVRTPQEFDEEHLDKATNINFYDEDFAEKIQRLPHDKKYLIHCHSGVRAAKTAKLMQELGFEQVWVVEGVLLE